MLEDEGSEIGVGGREKLALWAFGVGRRGREGEGGKEGRKGGRKDGRGLTT